MILVTEDLSLSVEMTSSSSSGSTSMSIGQLVEASGSIAEPNVLSIESRFSKTEPARFYAEPVAIEGGVSSLPRTEPARF